MVGATSRRGFSVRTELKILTKIQTTALIGDVYELKLVDTSSGFLINDDRESPADSRLLRNCAKTADRFNSTRSRIESRTALQYVK